MNLCSKKYHPEIEEDQLSNMSKFESSKTSVPKFVTLVQNKPHAWSTGIAKSSTQILYGWI